MHRFGSRRSRLAAGIAACAWIAAPPIAAQSSLTPGDVALIGWIDNGSPNDAFALVALADLDPGTAIYFTDNGWDGATGGYRNTNGPQDGNGNETLAMLTVNTTIAAGTILDTTQVDPSFTWTTSGAVPGATSGTFGPLVLTQSGDQVYAFQHDTGQNPMNTPVQTHLFVLDDTGAFEDATTTGEGNVPPGLSVVAHTAVTFAQSSSSQSFMAFDTSVLAGGTKHEWLAAIADETNWMFGSSGALPTGSVVVNAPTFVPYCFGDGTTATPCPCGNTGMVGHGCDNSSGTGGVMLSASGSPSPDTVVLTSSNHPTSASVFFLQGNLDVPGGGVFGDGVRCVGGLSMRFGGTVPANGVAAYPGPGEPPISAVSAAYGDPIAPGSVRYYQALYRDRDLLFCGYPPGSTFNVSNGVQVTW